ncbi:SMR family transporter [Paenibacillus sp. JTLBN-2024]
MVWLALFAAGCLDVIGFIMLKRTSVRDTWMNNLLMLGAFGASLGLLSFALQSVPLGVAYSVWTGIGTFGTAIVGILFSKNAPQSFAWLPSRALSERSSG